MEKEKRTDAEKKTDEMRKQLGECFMCRHHGVIERICRITGCLCKYPTKGCPNKDYPPGW